MDLLPVVIVLPRMKAMHAAMEGKFVGGTLHVQLRMRILLQVLHLLSLLQVPLLLLVVDVQFVQVPVSLVVRLAITVESHLTDVGRRRCRYTYGPSYSEESCWKE
jgi:hypothetical protein